MNGGIKTELKIPDLWYDFYARLLPGTAFIATLYILWHRTPSWPTVPQALILAAAGYFCGLVSQAVSSEISRWVELLVVKMKKGRNKKKKKEDKLYVEKIAKKLTDHESKILGKMHGEVAFYTQCFLFSLVLLGLQIFPRFNLKQDWTLIIVAIIVFFILAFLTAWRRRRRADDYLQLKQN